MFHVVGSTPEAATLDDALQQQPPEAVELVTLEELRAARDELTTASGGSLAAVSLGTPHASLAELQRYVSLLGDRRVHPDVECLVSTGRDVLSQAARLAARLRAAGVELLTDTCSYIAPILRRTDGAVMTDSGKWAYYAPGNIGAGVVFGSSAECISSAVAGRVVRDEKLWGVA
jgi:hypothetical protein